MEQITVVRIDDSHIAEEQSVGGGKVRHMPAEEEEEEDSVFVIEYSNPEEEGESYQFTMSVDRSVPVKKPVIQHPAVRGSTRAPCTGISRPRPSVRPERKLVPEQEVNKEAIVSNKSVLELGEDYSEAMGAGKALLVCSMCPPPGRSFKRASGLAMHLRHLHRVEGKKVFFCACCKQTVRSQIQLDAHTRRHAHQRAVFTCSLCAASKPEATRYKGSRLGLKRHLEAEHPGVVPRCDICDKGFKTVPTYLADQFRHVGVSPYYCATCQIYEMTERGLNVHTKNHNKRTEQESGGNPPQTTGVSTSVENSATDDSDF